MYCVSTLRRPLLSVVDQTKSVSDGGPNPGPGHRGRGVKDEGWAGLLFPPCCHPCARAGGQDGDGQGGRGRETVLQCYCLKPRSYRSTNVTIPVPGVALNFNSSNVSSCSRYNQYARRPWEAGYIGQYGRGRQYWDSDAWRRGGRHQGGLSVSQEDDWRPPAWDNPAVEPDLEQEEEEECDWMCTQERM